MSIRVGTLELKPWRSRVLRFTSVTRIELERHFPGKLWGAWFGNLLEGDFGKNLGEIPVWIWPLNRGDCAVPANAELRVVVSALSDAPLDMLVRQLQLSAENCAADIAPNEFSDHIRFVGTATPAEIGSPEIAQAVLDPAGWIDAETSRLLSILNDGSSPNRLTLHLLTPFRLARPTEAMQPGHAFMDEFWFEPYYFFHHAWGRIWRIFCKQMGNKSAESAEPALPEPLPTQLTVTRRSLIWVDVPYRTSIQKDGNRSGVQGEVECTGQISELWLRVGLIAGSLHVGPESAMGFGRLGLTAGTEACRWPTPPESLRDRAISIDALSAARNRLRDDGEPGVDGVAPADVGRADERWLGRLAVEVRDGAYRPAPLRVIDVAKADGTSRQVVILTARDRLLQRAALSVLSRSVDLLLKVSSFGFRIGLDRQTAVDALGKARAEGFTVGIKADIAAFFDSVAWEDVESRLKSVFGQDPIVDLLMAWVRAPIQINGISFERTHGLPQGLPISPMLANLVLDQFDRQLLGAGFRLFRYSDDFVVLAKPRRIGATGSIDANTADTAEVAEAVQRALSPLGLTIRQDKTRPVHPNLPLKFLGLRVVPPETIFKVPADMSADMSDDDDEEIIGAISFGAAIQEATGRPRTV